MVTICAYSFLIVLILLNSCQLYKNLCKKLASYLFVHFQIMQLLHCFYKNSQNPNQTVAPYAFVQVNEFARLYKKPYATILE